MSKFDIELDLKPSHASLDQLAAGLNKHSADHIEEPGHIPIALFARGDQGETQGGIYGRINWNWLAISLLWVNPDQRGEGLGSKLLHRLESEAAARGCTQAHVDTFSFQAREFYVAHGYETFAELSDYPEGHSRIYLRKTLPADQ